MRESLRSVCQGQAEALNEKTNFWEAIEHVNQELADQELYISHFFTESQVILLPDWHSKRIPIPGNWKHLDLYRLGNIDLLLSKLMRDDPIDHADAKFIARTAHLDATVITAAMAKAHVPDSPEIQEQFELASRKLLKALADQAPPPASRGRGRSPSCPSPL